MRDRVNVTLTRSSGKLTAEIESLRGKQGQAMVARRQVSEKRGPAGVSYKSESGDFQMSLDQNKAHVTFKHGSAGVKTSVNCQKSSGLFEAEAM
jgi:hypothetical protein